MSIELFTQLSATGDQLRQQYELRKRFCIDHLKWHGRNEHRGMEFDEYDHLAAIYMMWRDGGGIARGLIRFKPCNQPYMIKDHWPHLVRDVPLPNRRDQWEITRLCLEQVPGVSVGRVLGQMMWCAEEMAKEYGITEYWWISPKERIECIVPHNHTYAGDGQQIEHEFCYAGWSDATNMIQPHAREKFSELTTPDFAIAA